MMINNEFDISNRKIANVRFVKLYDNPTVLNAIQEPIRMVLCIGSNYIQLTIRLTRKPDILLQSKQYFQINEITAEQAFDIIKEEAEKYLLEFFTDYNKWIDWVKLKNY